MANDVSVSDETAAQPFSRSVWPARLPKTVVPELYDLKISVDPDRDGFSGEVLIDAEAHEPAAEIFLHSQNLSFEHVAVNGTAIPAERIEFQATSNKMRLHLAPPLPAGKFRITIRYSGRFNRQMEGLYLSKSTYKGKPERYAFTKFEPTHARKMLPCFDEPDFKAQFKVTITAPSHLTVLSNMPAAKKSEKENAGGTKTVSFLPTPKMSTYLLAIAVARLVARKRRIAGVDVAAWARPEEIEQTKFALEVSAMALPWLNKYFGLRYQLPKLDLVAVPDFASGAMENWGMITFRDVALLVDPKMTSANAKRYVAVVVTHEIVHQWFGNLVTMKWWNDLWLNEAFAEWLSHQVVAEWKPKWNLWLEFEQTKHIPLRIDSLKHTRAIMANAATDADIKSMFDSLTYEKGGAVLRMIEHFLGEEKFQAGIRAYMKRHQYGNTEAADLWRELEAASGRPITQMADDWLTQPGYPVVSVEALSADNRRLKISQRRFSARGAIDLPGKWTIPLVVKYQTAKEKKPKLERLVIRESEETADLPGKGEVAWVYPNGDETGFFRTALAGTLHGALCDSLEKLSPAERIGFLNHLWARAQNGDAPIGLFLDAVKALERDPSRVVTEDLSSYLITLHERILGEKIPAYQKFAARILEPRLKRLGWGKPGDNDDANLSRAAVVYAFGAIAPTDKFIAEVRKRVKRYLSNPRAVDATLVSPLIALGAKYGDPALFDAYHQRIKRASTPEQRDQLVRGLAKFERPELAERLLAMTLTDEIRGQDLWKPLTYALGNPAVQGKAWSFVRDHWQDIRKKTGDRGCDRIIGACAALCKREWLDDARTFFSRPENEVKSSQRTLQQALESIELGIRFREKQRQPLLDWLAPMT